MKNTDRVYIKGATLVDAESFDNTCQSAILVRTVFEEERFLLGAIAATLQGAGYERAPSPENAALGIVLGVDTVMDNWKAGFFSEVVKDGPIGASPLVFPYTSPNAMAARATIAFNIKGDDITIASGPLSFLKALSYGAMLISSGVLEGVVVGGVAEGALFTTFLSAELSRYCISDIFEQRINDEGIERISTMKESFALFRGAMDESVSSRGGASLEVSDSAGNIVGMTVAVELFDKTPA